MNRREGLTRGFLIAGLVNVLGILIFSQGFTSEVLPREYPEVFSRFGQLAIVLWGLAYWAVARRPTRTITLVFALEKLVYVVSWVVWLAHAHDRVPALVAESALGGVFLAAYGLNDLAFMCFFLYAAKHTR